MLRNRAWERGAADLVSVAVGMVILAIATAGTAGAMVFGREAMIREEHYKVAAYALRGVMEEVQGELMYKSVALQSQNLGYRFYREVDLDQKADRNGNVEVVKARITRDAVQVVNLPETGETADFYVVTVRAEWVERDYAENRRPGSGQRRQIAMTTAVMPRSVLG